MEGTDEWNNNKLFFAEHHVFIIWLMFQTILVALGLHDVVSVVIVIESQSRSLEAQHFNSSNERWSLKYTVFARRKEVIFSAVDECTE